MVDGSVPCRAQVVNEILASLIGGAVATGVLLLVGWPVARLTHAPAPWIASWIAGVVALHSLMLVSQFLGVPVRLDNMAVGLAACGGAAFVALRVVRGDRAAAHPSRWHMGRWGGVFLAGSTIVFGLRAFLQPLAGADTAFRWDFLARQLTMLGHLDYYPPRTAADFAVYFYPDGMSPLVAACHWWTYAVRGAHDPSATYAMVTLTYVAAIVISARLGTQLGGRMGGQATVLALVGAPIFFWAFVQGQETGFTALGVIASLCYLRAARRGAGSAFMAGLAMTLVVLAREYGWAYFASGLVGAVWLRVPARRVAWFMATVLILAGPWYVRNWWLSGNPFYSLAVGSLFPVNEVHAGMLKSCRDSIGWSQLGLAGGMKIAGHLVQLV